MRPNPPFSRNDLSSLILFEGLSAPVLDEVVAVTRCRAMTRDTRIFNQGDSFVRAHLLVEGCVRIAQTGSDGGQIVVRFIGAGEMFGTVALFTDGRYPADADTLTDAIEFSWSEADLLKLMSAHSQIAINALKIVGKRIQEAQNRLRELSTQPVERRIAHTLLRLSRQAGRSAPEGIKISFPLRRKDIADICGTTLFSVSRVLTTWEKAGWVATRDQHLTIASISEIQRIGDNEST
jgi:CRP-like cAMP-binding protein